MPTEESDPETNERINVRELVEKFSTHRLEGRDVVSYTASRCICPPLRPEMVSW
jgi:hypothetical protein